MQRRFSGAKSVPLSLSLSLSRSLRNHADHGQCLTTPANLNSGRTEPVSGSQVRSKQYNCRQIRMVRRLDQIDFSHAIAHLETESMNELANAVKLRLQQLKRQARNGLAT